MVKKLTHVVVGTDPGPVKMKKLKEMPYVKLINEDDLLNMIKTLPEQVLDESEEKKKGARRPQHFGPVETEPPKKKRKKETTGGM